VRIGLVTDLYFPWIAGPSVLLRNLGYGLAAEGHSVSLLAPSATGMPGTENDGPVEVTRIATRAVPFGHEMRSALWPVRAVSEWLQRTQPDVVHAHHPFPISASAILLARRRGIPVAATNHTIPDCSLFGIRQLGPGYRLANFAFGRWIAFLMSKCSDVAVPTDTAADALRKLGYRAPITIVSNGVDTDRFSPGPVASELRSRLGLDERPVILYTGRLDAEKQMGVWLRAAARLSARAPAQFVVGGNGSDRAHLESLATEIGLSNDVRFPGFVSDEEHPDLYRLADVYFITSPVELQSISTLEAMASGLPVVAVRAGALPELVRDGENGFLVEPEDDRQAAECLASLVTNDEKRLAYGSASRRIALGHDLRQSVKAYEQFLTRASQRHQGEAQRGGVPVSSG
jgi:1,2-diacylglycerol 3-alpha-glucosyltransferase